MAEGTGLLNRHTGSTCIEGSNPSRSVSKSKPAQCGGLFLWQGARTRPGEVAIGEFSWGSLRAPHWTQLARAGATFSVDELAVLRGGRTI